MISLTELLVEITGSPHAIASITALSTAVSAKLRNARWPLRSAGMRTCVTGPWSVTKSRASKAIEEDL